VRPGWEYRPETALVVVPPSTPTESPLSMESKERTEPDEAEGERQRHEEGTGSMAEERTEPDEAEGERQRHEEGTGGTAEERTEPDEAEGERQRHEEGTGGTAEERTEPDEAEGERQRHEEGTGGTAEERDQLFHPTADYTRGGTHKIYDGRILKVWERAPSNRPNPVDSGALEAIAPTGEAP
jgi:hypothetical protein